MADMHDTIRKLQRSLRMSFDPEQRKRLRLMYRDAGNSYRFTVQHSRSVKVYNKTQERLKQLWEQFDYDYEYIERKR
jgi:hypothetical protein